MRASRNAKLPHDYRRDRYCNFQTGHCSWLLHTCVTDDDSLYTRPSHVITIIISYPDRELTHRRHYTVPWSRGDCKTSTGKFIPIIGSVWLVLFAGDLWDAAGASVTPQMQV